MASDLLYANKFIVSCHGCKLPFIANNYIDMILIPKINGENVNIFFNTLDGEVSVLNDSYGPEDVNNDDYYQNYIVAMNTNDEIYKGHKYTNKHSSGNYVCDYFLFPDKKNGYSFVGYYYADEEKPVSLMYITKPTLFSVILNNIFENIKRNNVHGPFNILCDFCLVENEDDDDVDLLNDMYISRYLTNCDNDECENLYVKYSPGLLSDRLKD